MRKKFNDTGLCTPERHYMVDISRKIEQIVQLVEEEEYFSINRPRQFGKTTILSLLAKTLNQGRDCIALCISLEDMDEVTCRDQGEFISVLLSMFIKEFEFLNLPEIARFIKQRVEKINNMHRFSELITKLVKAASPEKSLVLMIDEVDKSSNNQLFLDFLGMLRKKYLLRNEGKDFTFQSIILAGVHDIKSLKLKIRAGGERKFNSPWNIAVDFEVDLSFNSEEIATMLVEYSDARQITPDIPAIADKLYYYTSGYPFLVSKLCKFMDEKISSSRDDKNWRVADVDEAFKLITAESYTTTLFDSLTKNLENNPDLYENVFNIVINGVRIPFNINVPVVSLGSLYGVLRNHGERCAIDNRIYEQRIYNYMMTKLATTESGVMISSHHDYYTEDGLNVALILQKFQAFMKEHYSRKDEKFLEREGRLLFLSFLKPIINGRGFDFKEPNVADERRMDIVITFNDKRYVVELKRWYGPKAHQKGLDQLSAYLDAYSLAEGYLLIYDFNKNKEYKQENIEYRDKRLFAVWV